MSETMTLATQREGQARTMTIAGGADPDRGHWYSPQFVNEYTERMRAENDALRAEVERLRAFVLELLGDHPELGNWDGFDLQELAVKHGLMRQKVPAPTEPCGEGCVCGEYYSGQEFRDGDVQCYALTIPRSPLPEPPAERGEG